MRSTDGLHCCWRFLVVVCCCRFVGTDKQASLMLKIVIAQWMNTAFITYFIHSISTAPTEGYMGQARGKSAAVLCSSCKQYDSIELLFFLWWTFNSYHSLPKVTYTWYMVD